LDLPTYTSIWRIEKRLYKLYDFRLPMPIPVGQIAVFTAITVPYVVVLKMAGLPFSHTLLWLYVLPPGVATWLVSRPVLEGKRLPELVVSQVRYLCEPRTWCRMVPLHEAEHIIVVARVWRRADRVAPPARRRPARKPARVPSRPEPARPQQSAPSRRRAPALAPAQPVPASSAVAAQPAIAASPAAARPAVQPAVAASPATARPAVQPAVPAAPDRSVPAPAVAKPAPATADPEPAQAAPTRARGPAAPSPAPAPARPVVTVAKAKNLELQLALPESTRHRPADRGRATWQPGVFGPPRRPGVPDPRQRDRARARLPLTAGHRVVVLGCTVGAGQTVTALMTAELLASLRTDQVAVLDLNPGSGSLAERARSVPPLTGSRAAPPSRLEVFTRDAAAASTPDADSGDVAMIFELLAARYPLTLADPGAAAVPRVLGVATQLVLVAPANEDAAAALAATREWLEAHGHGELAEAAITVLNGVSKHTIHHVEQAEALARGRSRAIVRIPWDDHLKGHVQERSRPPGSGTAQPVAGPLSPAALHAYTALAGLLVASVATAPDSPAAPGTTPVPEKMRQGRP
jgi:MinD-like ATPase involved in chromosome partitioning or flagellar assembly